MDCILEPGKGSFDPVDEHEHRPSKTPKYSCFLARLAISKVGKKPIFQYIAFFIFLLLA